MVHTLELSREISQETFENLINTLNGNWYNGIAWFTRAYEEKGIPMVCLRKFKPKRKNEKGEWITLDTEPYIYMIILTINTGVMFNGDGYLSNNVCSFTSDFTKAICDVILEQIPELEIKAEYRQRGYEEFWNTGKYPQILKYYYDLNAFKLRRIDYALDIATTPEQYIQLLECGKGIRRKTFERLKYDDTNEQTEENNLDELLEDDEPDFDDIEELLTDFSADTKYIYYKSKSVNINIYLKGEQLRKENLISPYNTLYDFLRIEIQVKKNKLNYLNQKHGVGSRDFHKMPIPEYETEILSYYIKQLTGTGLYVTHDKAKQIIDTSSYGMNKKNKLKKLLYLISKHHSIKKVLDKVESGDITELGTKSTVETYLREIQDMGINPVTLSRAMTNSIPKSTVSDLTTGTSHKEAVLLNLVDIVNFYNQDEIVEQEMMSLSDEALEQIDKL